MSLPSGGIKLRQHSSPIYWYPSTKQHGAIYVKTVINIYRLKNVKLNDSNKMYHLQSMYEVWTSFACIAVARNHGYSIPCWYHGSSIRGLQGQSYVSYDDMLEFRALVKCVRTLPQFDVHNICFPLSTTDIFTYNHNFYVQIFCRHLEQLTGDHSVRSVKWFVVFFFTCIHQILIYRTQTICVILFWSIKKIYWLCMYTEILCCSHLSLINK